MDYLSIIGTNSILDPKSKKFTNFNLPQNLS